MKRAENNKDFSNFTNDVVATETTKQKKKKKKTAHTHTNANSLGEAADYARSEIKRRKIKNQSASKNQDKKSTLAKIKRLETEAAPTKRTTPPNHKR
jgi:hypothetical protein